MAAPKDPGAPNEAVVDLLPSLEFLSRELSAEIRAGKMQINLEPRGLVVSLPQATFFPSGQDTIDPATYPVIEKVSAAIRKIPNPVRLEGHTDSVPIHNVRFRSNWELSAARSIAMLELLAVRYEIPRERLAVAGYADTVPAEPNDSEEGRARNRRVDIVVLSRIGLMREPEPTARTEPPPPAKGPKGA
jgi:chemotaxis protein MotB